MNQSRLSELTIPRGAPIHEFLQGSSALEVFVRAHLVCHGCVRRRFGSARGGSGGVIVAGPDFIAGREGEKALGGGIPIDWGG